MRLTVTAAALAAWLLWTAAPAAAAPRVVATIGPIHSLAAGVMAGVGAPRLLIRGAASPHAYALRPSGARALRRAEVVFWVGEEFESFLARPLRALGGGARVVALSRAPGVALLPARAGGVWEAHAGGAGPPAHARGEGERPGARDMHLWLSPANARAVVRGMARELGAADPARAARYRANARRLLRRLDALDAELRARLAPVAARPFIVFHDAFQYFERHYGLNAAGAITVSPDRPPGARRLSAIRRRILEAKAACVFREPQFAPGLVEAVVRGTPARIAVLDPLGAELGPGEDLYFTLMHNLAASFAACLSRG